MSKVVDNGVVKKTVYNNWPLGLTPLILADLFWNSVYHSKINSRKETWWRWPENTWYYWTYNVKIGETENKIPSITGLATAANRSDLVNKTDYDTKISDVEPKCFTTSDYNKFTVEILKVKITEKELVDKSDISGFINNSDLKAGQDKIVELQAFVSSYFRDKSLFEDDGTQNYFAFELIYR